MKKFNNLPRKEALVACDALLENSKVLLNSAKLLSQQGNHGVATSLTILGGEELVKAAFLYFHGVGFQFMKIEEFKRVFTNHVPKHQAAQVAELLRIFDALINLDDSSSEKARVKTEVQIPRVVVKYLKKAISFLEPIVKMGDNIEWWKKADNLKNRGLYVDFRDELLSPNDLTSVEYEKAVSVVVDLSNRFEKIKFFIDHMNQKNLNEVVKQVNAMQNLQLN